MCPSTFAALLGIAAGCLPGGSDLLAPADPRSASLFHPPPSPVAGLKAYRPVEARKDWGSPTQAPPTQPAGEGAMPAMKGMDMPGMDMGGSR